MLDESVGRNDEANIGNVENNNPIPLISNNDGANLAKSRQALLKKGGKKLRPTAPCPQRPPHPSLQKAQRNTPGRLSDLNNNTLSASPSTRPGVQPNAEPPTGAQTVLTLHHLKPGTKKELLKCKGGRAERGAVQPGAQPVRIVARHDQTAQTVTIRSHRGRQSQAAATAASQVTRKKDPSGQPKPSSLRPPAHREPKKPLHASDNVKMVTLTPAEPQDLQDGEKVYAGAKFSEPPSPSVLPKPPSHWVGENEPQRGGHSREQMTVHLKSLLKVHGES